MEADMQMIQFFVGEADSKIWGIVGGDLGFFSLRFTALFVPWQGRNGAESQMKTYRSADFLLWLQTTSDLFRL